MIMNRCVTILACALGPSVMAGCDSPTIPDPRIQISSTPLAAAGRPQSGATVLVYTVRADSAVIDTVAVQHAEANGYSPVPTLAWHPDHRQMAFSRLDSVIAIDADGSNRHILFLLPGEELSPVSWSPDGRQLAFGACRVQTHDCRIAVADLSANVSVRTVVSGGAVSSPVWSPSGNRLAYFLFEPGLGRRTLMSVRADGTDPQQLVAVPDLLPDRAAWSPDGGRIAFVTGSYATRRLQILRIVGGTVSTVAGGGVGMTYHSPAWSADGRHIAVLFSSDSAARKRPVLVDVDRGTTTPIAAPAGLETLSW